MIVRLKVNSTYYHENMSKRLSDWGQYLVLIFPNILQKLFKNSRKMSKVSKKKYVSPNIVKIFLFSVYIGLQIENKVNSLSN